MDQLEDLVPWKFHALLHLQVLSTFMQHQEIWNETQRRSENGELHGKCIIGVCISGWWIAMWIYLRIGGLLLERCWKELKTSGHWLGYDTLVNIITHRRTVHADAVHIFSLVVLVQAYAKSVSRDVD